MKSPKFVCISFQSKINNHRNSRVYVAEHSGPTHLDSSENNFV